MLLPSQPLRSRNKNKDRLLAIRVMTRTPPGHELGFCSKITRHQGSISYFIITRFRPSPERCKSDFISSINSTRFRIEGHLHIRADRAGGTTGASGTACKVDATKTTPEAVANSFAAPGHSRRCYRKLDMHLCIQSQVLTQIIRRRHFRCCVCSCALVLSVF